MSTFSFKLEQFKDEIYPGVKLLSMAKTEHFKDIVFQDSGDRLYAYILTNSMKADWEFVREFS